MSLKRALTLATLGLLANSAVTLATDGLIQTGAAPVIIGDTPYYNAGGEPGPLLNVHDEQIRVDDEEVFTLIKMILQSGALE